MNVNVPKGLITKIVSRQHVVCGGLCIFQSSAGAGAGWMSSRSGQKAMPDLLAPWLESRVCAVRGEWEVACWDRCHREQNSGTPGFSTRIFALFPHPPPLSSCGPSLRPPCQFAAVQLDLSSLLVTGCISHIHRDLCALTDISGVVRIPYLSFKAR
ncbi:hypothetical protein PENSPDRAFT_455757 [Peniophora sp. CONT]|nr:hypothetical protein PENSPDRAFT_455757 [Peniophora sp. CONT]